MFKKIKVCSPTHEETEIIINPKNIVFISEADIPTNIKGINGIPQTVEGAAIAVNNGMIFNTRLTVEEVIECLK